MERAKYVYNRAISAKVWEKMLFSAAFALIVSGSLWRSWETFYDTVTLLFVYTVWSTCCLPVLYKKLTVKLIRDTIAVVLQVFFADILVFGGYRTLRRYLGGVDVAYETTEQRGYIFLMNCLRLIVVCYCLTSSIPAFIKQTKGRKGRKKRKSI